MTLNSTFAPSPPQTLQGIRHNLGQLLLIRILVLAAQATALLFARYAWPGFHAEAVALILLAMGLITLISAWRLRRQRYVSQREFFGQLLIDWAGLSAVLYCSGGANNPFVSYYLVPLSISAAVLPWAYTWVFAALSITAYSVLLWFYLPLEALSPDTTGANMHAMHHHMKADTPGMSSINAHVIGMWLNFLFSTGLITWFVVKMAKALREQNQQLNQALADRLRDEHILSIAGQAANTAHELGTPLGTISILVEGLKNDLTDPHAQTDLDLIATQVARCKQLLQHLSQTAEQRSRGQLEHTSVDAFIHAALTEWQLMRPSARYHLTIHPACAQRLLLNDPAITQTLHNVLNNAATASNMPVNIDVTSNESHLDIAVTDCGPGLPKAVLRAFGQPLAEQSESGMGLGLMLGYTTLQRLGGELRLANRPEGGAQVILHIPL